MYILWSRSWPEVTAPASAKYPGFETLVCNMEYYLPVFITNEHTAFPTKK